MATLRDDLPHPRLAQPLPRSLLIRWSNNPENHRALLHLACGFITGRLATPTTYRDRFLAGRPAATGLSSRSDCCRIVRIRERETGSGERDHRSARYASMLPSARGMDRTAHNDQSDSNRRPPPRPSPYISSRCHEDDVSTPPVAARNATAARVHT